MLETIPNKDTMVDLIGISLFDVWNKLCVIIDEKYAERRNYLWQILSLNR